MLLLFLIGPAAASAATIVGHKPDHELEAPYFFAAEGETNDVSVKLSSNGRDLVVVDRGAPLEPRGRCKGGGAVGAAVRCRIPRDRRPLFMARLLDGADRLDARSFPGRVPAGKRKGQRTEVYVDAGPGNDLLIAGPSDGEVQPGFGDDLVHLGPGRDSVVSEDEPDGADFISGGSGRDKIEYFGRRGDVTVNLASAEPLDGEAGEGDTIVEFENLESGFGDDRLLGSSRSERITGGMGDDRIRGGGGDDRLMGDGTFEGGDDRIHGGAGSDRIIGEAGRDRLLGGGGADHIDSVSGVFLHFHGPDRARDRVRCGSGKDRARAEPRDRLSGCEQVRRSRR